MQACNNVVFMLQLVSGKNETVAVIDVIVVVFELIDELITHKESESLGLLTEGAGNNFAESFQINCVEYIEIIVFIVSDLHKAVFVDCNKGAQISIVKAVEYLLDIYLFPVVFIFTLS